MYFTIRWICEFAASLKKKKFPAQQEQLIKQKAPDLKSDLVPLSRQLFCLVNKRGIAALSDFALMTNNDYTRCIKMSMGAAQCSHLRC